MKEVINQNKLITNLNLRVRKLGKEL